MAAFAHAMFLSPDSALQGCHTRSRSFKNRPRPREHDDIQSRQRRNSMPSSTSRHARLSSSFNNLCNSSGSDVTDYQDSVRRVRSFKTTSKGVVNRGDSYKRKKEKHAILCSGIVRDESPEVSSSDIHGFGGSGSRLSCHSGSSRSSPIDIREPEPVSCYNVVVLGPTGVGKTSLTDQFMTSEYIGASGNGAGEYHFVRFIISSQSVRVMYFQPLSPSLGMTRDSLVM